VELGPCAAESGAATFDRIAACTDLVRIGRAGYAVYVARASAYAESGDRAAAVADLNAAITLRPDRAVPYAMRGALYLKDEAFRDGLVDLDRALVLDPGDEEALRTRAFAWDKLRAYPAAIEDYTALLALTKDDGYRYFRGFAYFHHGETAEALADFEAILTSQAPTVAAWGYRGRAAVREQAGAFADALADYTAALALDPSDDRAFLGRCRVAAAMGGHTSPGCAAASATAATR
jgi:tetratricopeptide (TPR) repeat protein